MLPWSRNWLSSAIKKDPAVSEALTNLRRLVRRYKDAAKPSSCKGPSDGHLSGVADLLRPGWKLFAVVCFASGVAGVAFSFLGLEFEADVWADLALAATVPVFVLGLSVVTLARSMSESGRFAVEYLNESCRMASFCWLTLAAVLLAFVGRFLIAVASLPTVVAGGLCAASLGAAITCLAMLAFVVSETIHCSLPGEAIRVVSQYAARKLCYAYLKETFVKLVKTRHRECLEQRCLRDYKSIYPPSQYYTRVAWTHLNPGSGSKDREILWDEDVGMGSRYRDRDYALNCLKSLDDYLQEHEAELYLSSPHYMGEQIALGTLRFAKGPVTQDVYEEVCRRLKDAIRLRRIQFEEEDTGFWDSQQIELNKAIERAVGKADPVQVRAYLDAVNEPLAALRETRRHRVVRDVYGQYVRRGCEFLELYLVALGEILARLEKEPKHRTQRAFVLARVLLDSVWDETQGLCAALDYHTMELFTWLVPQMYRAIKDAGDKGRPLLAMRAEFGGFYDFADGWLEDSKSAEPEAADKMRLVLHEGLTKWLLMVLEKPEESELVKQLCYAGRKIVFGRDGITFERGELVARHLLFAGHLMGRSGAAGVKGAAIERLFCEEYSRSPDLDFKDLVTFHLGNAFPRGKLDPYLNIFYTPQEEHVDLLTGSSSSSGFGMTGVREMALAFIYLAGSALADGVCEPEPITKDLSREISDDAIKAVAELFKNAGIDFGLEQLKTWRDQSKEREDKAEAKAIADAEFDDQKVGKWKSEFWEAYSTSSPVLCLCLKNGNYEIDNNALVKWRCDVPKMALIDWRYPISGADGYLYGRSHGRFMEGKLFEAIARKADRPSQIEGGLSETMAQAVGWLKKERCDGESAIVIVKGMYNPATGLSRDGRFLPSWREDVRSKGFDGFYDGFPLVWLRKRGEEDEKAVNTDEEVRDRVVAVDLRGWKGIKVKECVITQHKFGKLNIRTWTEREIEQAIESGKLKREDVDKARGNCPVAVSLYWQFSTDALPPVRAYQVQAPPDNNPEDPDDPGPATESPND